MISSSLTAAYRAIDYQIVRQICVYERAQNPAIKTDFLETAVLQVSHALGRGQSCLAMPEAWLAPLAEYAVVFVAGSGRYANQPLVLSENKLYIARYYFYEQEVLTQIRARVQVSSAVDFSVLRERLAQLFPSTAQTAKPDWQKIAAASACMQRLSIITGGPGTGKTTTVTKLLSALLSFNPKLAIALAAPTGKAAARMTESIRRAKSQLDQLFYPECIPEQSHTLHRLLGWSPRGFRYHQDQHLPYEVVVVDEASMIDLPMMSHLLAALSPHAQLILLGDKDQLASVEVGSVLADLCDAGREHGPSSDFAQQLSVVTGENLSAYAEKSTALLQNALAQLRWSYRFHQDSGIGLLARAVNAGEKEQAQDVWAQFFSELSWLRLDKELEDLRSFQPWQALLHEGFTPFAQALAAYHAAPEQNRNPETVFHAFNHFQLLVAIRRGHYGVEAINERVARWLQNRGFVETSKDGSAWYAGRVVMISENNYDLNLFNGDIGIALWHEGKIRVAFMSADSQVRWLLPSRLPAHETAFAITVHKSQGSEFAHVALLLPVEHQPVITRELIYTAITRAKTRFTLLSSVSCWEQGLALHVERASGLRDILWPNL